MKRIFTFHEVKPMTKDEQEQFEKDHPKEARKIKEMIVNLKKKYPGAF